MVRRMADASTPRGRPFAERVAPYWSGWGLGLIAAHSAVRRAALALRETGLPVWDPAAHGLSAVDLADALRRVDLPGFLDGINRQVTWPFVGPLLLAPFLAIAGPGYRVGDAAAAALCFAAVLALFAAGTALHPRRGAWVGLAAAVLALTSPQFQAYATLTMLEMPGTLLVTVASFAYLKSRDGSRPWAAAAGVVSAALFLCKYNYGLLWLIPVFLHEADHWRRERGLTWMALASGILTAPLWRHPFARLLMVYAAVLGWIVATGGIAYDVGSLRISMRSPGNRAYGFFLLIVGWAIVHLARHRHVPRILEQALTPRRWTLLLTFALPTAIWLLIPYPNRVREMVGFLQNREGGPWTWERLVFYPRAWANDFHAAPVLGGFLLIALLIPLRGEAERSHFRFLRLAASLGFVMVALHSYQGSRFLLTVAPLLWLCGAWYAVHALEWVLVRAAPILRETAWVATAFGLLALAAFGPIPDPQVALERAPFFSSASLTVALDRVVELSGESGPRPRLLGASNRLSPALLAWHARLTRSDLPRDRLPRRVPSISWDSTPEQIDERVESLRTAGAPVIAALPEADAPYDELDRREVAADWATFDRMVASGRWTVASDVTRAGMRVVKLIPISEATAFTERRGGPP